MAVNMTIKKGLLYGVGINDADYVVKKIVNGKTVTCIFYKKWSNMIKRCYSELYQKSKPSYVGCKVCDEWLTFSNFKRWMEKQDWQGKELDKDILVKGNKVYSPDTCCFVDSLTNHFTMDSAASRGLYPTGVHYYKAYGRFMARCNDPFSSNNHGEYLGYFDTPEEAHEAWRSKKHEHAQKIASMQSDENVAAAIRLRYAK